VRKQAGLVFVTAGGLLLSFASGRYALGAVRADQARQEWDAAAAARAVAGVRAAAAIRPQQEKLVAGAPVAHLVIPAIDLDDIVLEGVDGDDLNAGPGHVPGSVLPGDEGNAVISAHRDRHFSHFDRLQIGDTLTTESTARRTTWRIVSRKIIDKDAPALFNTRDATLTLTTCWPIRYLGSAPDRLILTAKPIRE
jgi:sortase A